MAEMARPLRRTNSEQTRQIILSTAVSLFAKKGLDAVSLAEINRAAGQRNATALHYHFGGKDGLVQAIFDKHTPRVNQLREEMLDALTSAPLLNPVLRVLIEPLAEQVRDEDGGADYLQFLGQVNVNPKMPRSQLDKRSSNVLERQHQLFRQALARVPEDVSSLRMEFAVLMIFAALAGYARAVQREGFSETRHRQLVDQLSASAEAVLDFAKNPGTG